MEKTPNDKKFYSTHGEFKRKGSNIKEESDQIHKGHSLSNPSELTPRIKPKRPPMNKLIPKISKVRNTFKSLQKRNAHITKENNELKVSLSFDEENYETKETENTKEEDSILGLRRTLSFYKNIFPMDKTAKDDSYLDIRSKTFLKYSSIFDSTALTILRRNLSSDLKVYRTFIE